MLFGTMSVSKRPPPSEVPDKLPHKMCVGEYVRVCWNVLERCRQQQLPFSVIPVQCEESVCGFQAKQVSLCMSQLVGAIHECGWQEHTRVDVWLWVCSQSPAD